MTKVQRAVWFGAFALVSLGGCTEDDGLTVAEGTAKYGDYWGQWCEDLDCDPNSPEWQDGRINGHNVRSVDTCAPSTDYPGDDKALCPPKEGEGFQLHFGPDNYDDVDEVARYLADPQEENEECEYVRMPNTEAAYVNQFAGTMRPQSHHMILWGPVGEDHPEGLSDCGAAAGLASGFLLGSQTPTVYLPDLASPTTPEESKTVNMIAPDMLVALDLHYVNRTPDTILRESWVNLYTTELRDIDQVLNPIFLAGARISVPPMSTGTTFNYSCPAEVDMQVSLLSGHHHANSPRFSVWVQRTGSTDRELVYESYNALDPLMATYADNYALPVPNRDNGISGGKSGKLNLAAGDRLVWECEFDNPTNVTVSMGETSVDQMCNLFGAYISDTNQGTWNAAGLGGNVCVSSDILGNVGSGAL